jgi:small subunit ribosomal protein S13
LTYIFGIGRKTSGGLLDQAQVNRDTRVRDLSDKDLVKIRKLIQELTIEGDLRRSVNTDLKRLIDLGCYRGLRHRRGLPCHGQRTKTNARTRKGPKRLAAPRKK